MDRFLTRFFCAQLLVGLSVGFTISLATSAARASNVGNFNEDSMPMPPIEVDNAASSTTTGDEQGYDAIVNQLNRENTTHENTIRAKHARSVPDGDPFSQILFHPGFGIAGLAQTVELGDGRTVHLNQRGIQASLGIDLFSRNWLAEGTARSFGASEESGPHGSVQEFELKIVYHDHLSPTMGYHFGGGLSGRYLTVEDSGATPVTYTTPNSVATVGLDFFLSEKFSVGLEATGRSAMISETPDHNSVDGTVRLDFHL